jgi:hypothetical protein
MQNLPKFVDTQVKYKANTLFYWALRKVIKKILSLVFMIQSLRVFPSIISSRKKPKISLTVWEAFCVPKIFWAEKLLQNQIRFFCKHYYLLRYYS